MHDHYVLRHICSFQNGIKCMDKIRIINRKISRLMGKPSYHQFLVNFDTWAANNEFIGIVKFLLINDYNESFVEQIIAAGNVKCAIWINQNIYLIQKCDKIMDYAARYNNIKLLEWLHQNNHGCCTTDAMCNAAFHGNVNALQWLHDNRTEGINITEINQLLRIPKFHTEINDARKWFRKHKYNVQCDSPPKSPLT